MLHILFEVDGHNNNLSDTIHTSDTCEITTSTIVVEDFGLIAGDTYTLNVTVAAAESGMSGSDLLDAINASDDIYSYSFEAPVPLTIPDIEISNDYESFIALICNEEAADSPTMTVDFSTNGYTETATISSPAAGTCTPASVNVDDFGLIIPLTDYTLTVDADGVEESATFRIIPDVEITEVGLIGNELYGEVCALGTFGDELVTMSFFISRKIDKVIGITLPENNTCQTFTAELTDEELALIETGDDLQVYTEYPSGEEVELDFLNNHGYYTF